MPGPLLIYVSLSHSSPADVGLGDASRQDGNWRTWLLKSGEEALGRVGDAVLCERIVSAYVSIEPMPSDKLWLAAEWHRRIVVHPAAEEIVAKHLTHPEVEAVLGGDLLIFTPTRETEEAGVQERLRYGVDADRPIVIEVDPEEVENDPQAWLGEYGRDDVGGWVTLVSAATPVAEGRVRIQNFTALGFRVVRDEKSLWSLRRAGSLRTVAAGFTRGRIEHDLSRAGFSLAPDRFDFAALARSSADYCIAVEMTAPVDPRVIIGSGTVFEQLSPNHAQNLAVASDWQGDVDAGATVGAVLPAWCLNANLSGPVGQPLRLTPLAFTGDMGDQGRVWADIARRRASGA